MTGTSTKTPSHSAVGLVFAMPATLLLLLLVVLPLVVVVTLAFTDYHLGDLDITWVGLDNFLAAFSAAEPRRGLLNTLLYVAIVLPASVLLGLLVALLVSRRRRSRRVYEVLFFLPVTATMAAMAIVWQYLLHGRIGPLNALLGLLGIPRIDFLTDPDIALWSIAAIGVWQSYGFATLLFLAGLSAIPRSIYEAAALDGIDGGPDRLFRITLPLLAPTSLFVVITTSITAFQVFDTVAVLTRGGPMQSTDVLLYQVYRFAFQYSEMGFGSALASIFLFVILAISFLQFRLTDRRIHYGAQG